MLYRTSRTHYGFDNPHLAGLHKWCAHSEFITNAHGAYYSAE